MRFLRFLLAALLLAPLAALHAADKPNIVFILADDAGIGDFSAYGCKYGVTPNIDRLATEGMRFTRAYSGNAVCGPSRSKGMPSANTLPVRIRLAALTMSSGVT